MANIYTRSGLLACLLALSLAITGTGNFSEETKQLNISPATVKTVTATGDTLSTDERYEDNISALAEYFERKGLSIQRLLQDSRFELYETIGDKFKYSAEKKSIDLKEYKKILGFEDKSERIIDFVNTYSEQLTEAEERFGISRYVISAILGVESDFGRVTGSYNPFNTYVSMYAVGYREQFARAQLEELLVWVKKHGLDVFELNSSYAGAMAYAQFIPYSLNKWFIGDDIFDMRNNILSVANYLAYFKERTGSVKKAVFRYNPSSLYASIVMDLAEEAENSVSDAAS